MANTLLTTAKIMRESLMILKNELTFTRAVNREYSDEFAVKGAKIGATVNARKPPRYQGRTGQALSIEGSQEGYVPITLNTQFGVDISFSSADLALSIDDFGKRFLQPAMAAIANKIDADGCGLYTDINRVASTVGQLTDGATTQAEAMAAIMGAKRILTENGAPQTQRVGVLGPASMVGLVTGFSGLYNPQATISRTFTNGALGDNILGFDWAEDANIASFTPSASGGIASGSSTGTLTASGATTIAVASVTAGTVPKGTVFSIAGVYAINPQNRQSTGQPMQFVVTADTTVTTTGTLPIYPAYIPSGQFATCTGSAAGGSTLTLYTGATAAGPYQQNLAFHPNAFTLATADLDLPRGVDMAERMNDEGISMRMVRAYDINSDMFPVRFDVLYGWKTIYPELAVRITG